MLLWTNTRQFLRHRSKFRGQAKVFISESAKIKQPRISKFLYSLQISLLADVQCRFDDPVGKFPAEADLFPFKFRKCLIGKIFEAKFDPCKRLSGHVKYSFKCWPRKCFGKALEFTNHGQKLKKTTFQKLAFYQNFSGHVECSSVVPVGKYLLKGRTSLAQSPKMIKKT